LIKLKYSHQKQSPRQISDLFNLIKHTTEINTVEFKLLEKIEQWWLEWYFALQMQEQLSGESRDMPMSLLSQSTLNPMRKHEISHYAKLFTVLPMPICNVCSKTGDILKVNQRFVDVFGYTVEDVPNLNIWWKKAYPDPHYRESVQSLWANALKKAKSTNNDISADNYRVACSDGTHVVMEVSGINIGEEYLAVFNDATERLEAEDILRDMAFLDALTKIANRRRFDEKLIHEFNKAKECAGELSIIIIDVDLFKQFNDRYGHIAGDACLYDVAQTIASAVNRPEDFVARYGGEEFVILLPDTNRQGSLFIAEQIQKAIEGLAIVHEGSYSGFLSVSMGINTLNGHYKGNEVSFVKDADTALYYAKEQGRNCIALSPEH
ncbi:diguanylate cyclase, partial [Pseudoalteromonas sp. BSi20652]|uniref:sensor domain-containing diguanylate cyclase n=1 Tax=Pseudoalteromonas sp. BSi20652 TaxID=388384 RepID=UPI000517C355